jgi:Cu-processing system permease protein
LLGTEGAAAFGAASLAFLRFTGGTLGAGVWLGVSVLFWIVLLPVLAVRRLNRADI